MITRPEAQMRELVRRGRANQIACFVITALRIVPTLRPEPMPSWMRSAETEGPLPVRRH